MDGQAAATAGETAPASSDGEAERAARLEAELLSGLLTRLPPGTPDDLVADTKERLRTLGVSATEPPPAPAVLAPAPAGSAGPGGGG